MTCWHITFWRSVLSDNFAAAFLEKYLYWGDETETPMGSLANCLFPDLVFKCMLLFCLYPVIDTIPSLYFHIICPCCLSEKKWSSYVQFSQVLFVLGFFSSCIFPLVEWCPMLQFCFVFFREYIHTQTNFLSLLPLFLFLLSSLSFFFLNFL